MNVHLPETLQHFVETQIEAGRFTSENEAITEAVRLLAESEELKARNGSAGISGEAPWETVLRTMGKIPDAELDRLPSDGAAQLDHYVYGTPKRPNP